MAQITLPTTGERGTPKKLWALASVAALIGVVSTAQAEDATPTLGLVPGAQHQDTHLVVLTDTEMDTVTAGHTFRSPTNNEPHTGWAWFNVGGLGHIKIRTPGLRGCTVRSCPSGPWGGRWSVGRYPRRTAMGSGGSGSRRHNRFQFLSTVRPAGSRERQQVSLHPSTFAAMRNHTTVQYCNHDA
jgi:hypothetical protein